jgi:hypothetical protein
MNAYMQGGWQWVEGMHKMRYVLLESLSDADMAFTPGGAAMTLGALCREMGNVQHATDPISLMGFPFLPLVMPGKGDSTPINFE